MKNNFQIFKFSSLLIALTISNIATAQVDRTKAPKPLPAPAIKVGTPAKFVLPNGLKVYVVQNNKLPRVTASLSLDVEGISEGKKAGTSNIAGGLLSAGTTAKSKDVIDEEIDFLGASLSTGAISANVNSLTNNFEKAFSLMAESVLKPAFPQEEFDKSKKRMITGLEGDKDDANSISRKVTSKLTYGAGHPYSEFETKETVESITMDDIKKYYNTYWKPNIAYLVFVGDITPANAQKLATKYFGSWKKGMVPKSIVPVSKPQAKTLIAIVDRPTSVQSVISIGNPIVLKPGSADVIPSSVMNSILGEGSTGHLYKNLRETHGFTYGAYSGVSEDKFVGRFRAGASVRNEKTDSAVQEFLVELNNIRNKAVTAEELSNIKSNLNGSFARSLESPSTIAQFALSSAINNLPPNYYQNYLTNLSKVDIAAVQQMANKYIMPKNLLITIVGNAKEIAKGLDKYGEVKYFDMYGNETKPNETKAVDGSITGESIIDKFIVAMGGKEAIANVKDLQMIGSATIPGAPMKPDFTRKSIAGTAYVNMVSAMNGAMVLQKQSVINGVYKESGQGGNKELTDQDKEELDEELLIVNELYYIKNNYKLSVKGIESVEGKDAYEVAITSAKGRSFSNFYDVATGLKVKTVAMVDAPGVGKVPVPTMFADYKAYNGVQLPTKVIIDQGVKIEVIMSDVKVNTGLKVSDL